MLHLHDQQRRSLAHRHLLEHLELGVQVQGLSEAFESPTPTRPSPCLASTAP